MVPEQEHELVAAAVAARIFLQAPVYSEAQWWTLQSVSVEQAQGDAAQLAVAALVAAGMERQREYSSISVEEAEQGNAARPAVEALVAAGMERQREHSSEVRRVAHRTLEIAVSEVSVAWLEVVDTHELLKVAADQMAKVTFVDLLLVAPARDELLRPERFRVKGANIFYSGYR